MKAFFALVVLAGAVAGKALEKRSCAGDNCLNAVRNKSLLGSSDCSAFLTQTSTTTTTVPAATLTITATTTASGTETTVVTVVLSKTTTVRYTGVAKRAEPTLMRRGDVIPTYASWCSGSVRYSSACSCIGVTSGTTTVTATEYGATTTSTLVINNVKTTTIKTTTTTYSTATALPTFKLQAGDPNNFGFEGLYVKMLGGVDNHGSWGYPWIGTDNIAIAAYFTLNTNGTIMFNGSFADQDTNGIDSPYYNGAPVYIDPLVDWSPGYNIPVICDISTGYLQCSCQGNTVWQSCRQQDDHGVWGFQVYLSRQNKIDQSCRGLTLKVIPI